MASSTLLCARSLGACRSTAIRCPLCPPGHSENTIVGRDLCTRS
ncbi:unnamed protein product [Staurois parvus]|uniref:Uncharacterized protein n=1 Tax=Staurois parvus TaxID=386267 RepID=A0ABN9GQ29_9NEOB|nr:unnamed protein product [Staurois parvus]